MANKAVVEDEMETPEITMVDPSLILTDRNTRHSLLADRVEALKEKIIEDGEVLQPIKVEALSTKEMGEHEGYEYRAVFGHYRIAATMKAREEGHDILMPVIVIEPLSTVDRLKMQLSENLGRSDMTPIDKAKAMKAMMDAGMSRMEIRAAFSTPGGRKGLKVQPLSNSSLNMTMSFLELDKDVQKSIHNGEIGVQDAYFLTTLPPEKRSDAVQNARAKRSKELEDADELETKYLELEKKRIEAEQKLVDAQKAIETAKEDAEKRQETLKEKTKETADLYIQKSQAATEDEKAALDAKHKEAEKATKEAAKELEAKRREIARLLERAEKEQKAQEERKAKLAKAKEDADKARKAAPKKLDIKKSAAAEVKNAPNTDGVPISMAALKKVVDQMALPGSYPKVQAIGKLIQRLLVGRITDGNLVKELAILTGERTEPASKKTATEPKMKKAS